MARNYFTILIGLFSFCHAQEKPIMVYEQEIIHLDLSKSGWFFNGDDSPHKILDKQVKAVSLNLLIESRIKNRQSLDIPVNVMATRDGRMYEGFPPLIEATRKVEYFAILKRLLALGADPNITYFSRSPLNSAVGYNNCKAVAALIVAGADCKNKSLLANATTTIQIMELLLANGADPNERLKNGKTSLFCQAPCEIKPSQVSLACRKMELLLMHGADPNARDNAGRTPLFYLAGKGKCIAPVLELLKYHGAWVSVRDYEGHTAFCEADRSEGALSFVCPAVRPCWFDMGHCMEYIFEARSSFKTEKREMFYLLIKSPTFPFKGLPRDMMRIIFNLIFKDILYCDHPVSAIQK